MGSSTSFTEACTRRSIAEGIPRLLISPDCPSGSDAPAPAAGRTPRAFAAPARPPGTPRRPPPRRLGPGEKPRPPPPCAPPSLLRSRSQATTRNAGSHCEVIQDQNEPAARIPGRRSAAWPAYAIPAATPHRGRRAHGSPVFTSASCPCRPQCLNLLGTLCRARGFPAPGLLRARPPPAISGAHAPARHAPARTAGDESGERTRVVPTFTAVSTVNRLGTTGLPCGFAAATAVGNSPWASRTA